MNKKLFSIAFSVIMMNCINIGHTMNNKAQYNELNNIDITEEKKTNQIIQDIDKKFWNNKNKISQDANIMINNLCNIIINKANTYLIPKIHSLLQLQIKQFVFYMRNNFTLHNDLSNTIIEAQETKEIIQNKIENNVDDFIDDCKNFTRIINTIIEWGNESLELSREQINNIRNLFQEVDSKDDIKACIMGLNILYEKLTNNITNIINNINNNSQKIMKLIPSKKYNKIMDIISNTVSILQTLDNKDFLDNNDKSTLEFLEVITKEYFDTLLNNLKYSLNLHKQYHNPNIQYLEDDTNYNDGKIHIQHLQYKNLYNNIIDFTIACNKNGDEIFENISNFIRNKLKLVLFNNYTNNKTISNDALNNVIDEVLLNIYSTENISNKLKEIQKKLVNTK